MKKFTLLKTVFISVILFAGALTARGETLFSFTGSGASSYPMPLAEDWSTEGTVVGGAYVRLGSGSIISPLYDPHSELFFAYSIAAHQSSGDPTFTQLFILDESGTVKETFTLESASTTSYNSFTQTIGNLSYKFKIKITGGETGRRVCLRNIILTGTPITEPIPTISTSVSEIPSMTAVIGNPAQQKITVSGVDLEEDITLTIKNDDNGFFVVSPEKLEAQEGYVSATEITITYTPTAAGSHTASLLIESAGATSLSFDLEGTATIANPPTVRVSETSIPAMYTQQGNTDTQKIHVSGENLSGDIQLSLENSNGNVFSLSQTKITPQGGTVAATEITITYAPEAKGPHTSTLKIESAGATPQTFNLTGNTEHYTGLMVANFEGNGTDKMTEVRFGMVGNGNPFEVVDNPYKTGNNTSAKVLKISDVVMFGGFHLNLTRNITAEEDKISNGTDYSGLRMKYRVNDPAKFSALNAGINVNGMTDYMSTAVWSDTDKDWKTATFHFGALPTSMANIQIQMYKALWSAAGSPIQGLEIYLDDIEFFKEPAPEPQKLLVIANFEGDGTDRMCDERFQKVGNGSDFTVVDNPYKTGNNTSAKVMKIHNFNQAGSFHLRLSSNITSEDDKINNAKDFDGLRLKYKVNDPATYGAQDALIKIYGASESTTKGIWSTDTEEWKTLTFNFKDLTPVPGSIPSIHVILYNSQWGAQPGLEIYIDDVEFFKNEDNSVKQLSMIQVAGRDIEFFNPDTLAYVYNLPYTHQPTDMPAITYTAGTQNQDITFTPAANLTGTEAERTALITIKKEETVVNEYKIIFNILPELHIYLCLGQSNMSGYGEITKADEGIIDNTYLLTPGKKFEGATNPFNRYSTISNGNFARISPAYGFAKALIGESTQPVGLLVNARNGSSMADWGKSDNNNTKLYANTLERALEAKKWGTIKGIIWHQGESDAWQPTAYPNLIKSFVNSLRTDLGDTEAEIFFVAGEIAYWRQSGTSQAFNEMIHTVSTFVTNSDWVSAEGLTPYLDETDPHFDRQSAIILGGRYAEKVIAKFYTTDESEVLLNDIKLNDVSLEGFNKNTLHYNVTVQEEWTAVPKVTYTKVNENAEVAVTNAVNLTGTEEQRTTTIVVSYQDKSATYTITFEPIPVTDNATLSGISVDGKELEFFSSGKVSYKQYLPYSYSGIPEITYTAENNQQEIALTNVSEITSTNPQERTATLLVTSGDKSKQETYSIEFEILSKLDLYLCIGQSNMAGRGYMEADKGDLEPVENSYLFTPGSGFEEASNPLNKYSNIRKEIEMQEISPAYGFAKYITANVEDSEIGLLVNARGGTSMSEWSKGNEMYDKTVERAQEALKWGEIKAILWHQGESNVGDATYLAELNKMVSNLRTDLLSPESYFLAGELVHTWEHSAAFNTVLQTISGTIPNSGWVSAEGLQPRAAGDVHFDREGNITLGERYAQKVIEKFYPATNIPGNTLEGVNYFVNDNILTVTATGECNIRVYDLYGRTITDTKFQSSYITELPSQRIFLMLVELQDETFFTKIITK